jgi:hypothetical protein
VGDCRDDVRGDHGCVRAEFKHDDAEEEAGDDVEQELIDKEFGEQDDGASRDGASCDCASCDFEEKKLEDERAAEAS